MRLKDRVAIVTGGGRGIGAEYCRGLSEEGAAVVVADIDGSAAQKVATELTSKGAKAVPCTVDTADAKMVGAMAALAEKSFGGIDILVNNAAMYANLTRRKYDQISEEEFDRVMAVNVKAIWLCTKVVAPSMKKRGRGKIINIGSSSIFLAGNSLVHYVASKIGVIGLTRALAREVGDDNICMNTIMPGLTDSESNRTNTSRAYLESEAQARCLKRIQSPRDLVGAVIFFASDESNFISGQSLIVDGGRLFN